ncbi:MAG: phosphoglycerate dehydrogenase [Gaiellales bacterium]|nr:phosphoglycerate dehydrogenase [Gaiellales bacterium]
MDNLKNMKVWVSELVDDEAIAALKEHCEVVVKYKVPREEQLAMIGDFHGVIIRSETVVDKEFLDAAKNLRIVGRGGSGLDNVDIDYATQKGVIVCNTPESNIVSACEQTWSLMLSSSRNTAHAWSFIRSGQWDRKRFQGSELYGKTLGIIGLGRIGGLVSTRAKAFGMNVIAYDPYIADGRFEQFGVEKKAQLDDLVKEADVITIHTPKTRETLGMISDREIGLMKQGVRLVNCARGGLYDEDALVRGLKSGKIASLGIDVWVHEPAQVHALYEFDNVVGTPHLGASTFEAAARVGSEVVGEVIAGLRGEIVKNAVNIPSVSEQSYAKLRLFISLAEKMGKLYGQIRRESVKQVEIEFSGREIENPEDAKILSVVALKGVLEASVTHGVVNFVNAELLARERGIEVKERIALETGDYSNMIRLLVTEEGNGTFEIAGTVLERKLPRIIKVGEYSVAFFPEGRLIYAPHQNRPGVIGKVGMAMAEYNVNIAKMVVGEGVTDSIMILNVDNRVPEEVLVKCRTFDEISDMKVIEF